MTFSSLWPLLLIILIPVIIILYMLKQKATDHTFSSIMLWQEVYKNIEATKPWEKLKNNLLMYLQILTVIGLIFALTGPYLKNGGDSYSNVLIVIDNSGSMNFAYNDEETRFEEEINRAIDYVNSLDDSANVTVMTVNDEAKLLFSGLTDKGDIRKKLKDIKTTELAGDLNNGISMVSSIVKQWENYQVVMFTDSQVALGELDASVINLYSEGENASVDYVSYGYEDDKLVVLAKVTNYGKGALETDINLYGDEGIIGITPIVVAPGESQVAYFTDISYEGTYLKAEINKKDALLYDNVAYTVMNSGNVSKILLISESNVFMEKALASSVSTDVYKANSIDAIDGANPFDIYVFDGVCPDELPEGNIIFLNVDNYSDGDINYVSKSESLEGSLLTFLNGDISTYIEKYQFGVNGGYAYNLPVWGKSFIDNNGKCVGYYGQVDGRKIVSIGFDLHNSDIALQTEFPIMIANIVEYMNGTNLVSQENIQTGDMVSFNPSINGSDISVTDINDNITKIDITGALVYSETDNAGVYKVTQKVNDENKSSVFVANFPVEEESNVVSGENEEIESSAEIGKLTGGRELSNILIILLLVLLVVEWIVYVKQR